MTRGKRAVVIGISDYLKVPTLKFGAKDAADIAAALQTVGFDEGRITVVHDNANLKPQRYIIFDELGGLRSQLDEDDVLLFYFSGHGMIEDDTDYLLPVDASSKALKNTGIAIQDTVEYLKASGSRNIVMFLDACRNELKTGKGVHSIGANAKSVISEVEDDDLAVFFSCEDHERSFEIDEPDIKQSAFTYCLLQAIGNREISTVDQTAAYLTEEVKNLNGRYDLLPQRPYVHPHPTALGEVRILELMAAVAGGSEADDYIKALADMYMAQDAANEKTFSSALFWDVQAFLRAPDDMGKLRLIRDLCRGETTVEQFEFVWTTLRSRVGRWGAGAVGDPRR